MPWYEDWFDRAEYELVYRRRDESEAERAVDLVERIADPPPKAELLDVGCGRGRHTRALARRDYRVTGIDLSGRALSTACERAREEGLSIAFRRQDMRRPMGAEAFDGAVNFFSSFGYFKEEDGHQQAISAVAEALRPGGFFVQDFMNAPAVRSTLVPRSTRTEDGFTIEERRWIEAGRIEKEITLRAKNPAANGKAENGTAGKGGGENGSLRSPNRNTFRESVRLFELSDFRRLYEHAGLQLHDTFGDYDGSPHRSDSPRLIMLSRKE